MHPSEICDDRRVSKRLIVASHAAVVPTNRVPYESLDLSVTWLIPSRWRDAYRRYRIESSDSIHAVSVLASGRPQRYLPLRIPRITGDFLLVEEEAFSLAAWRYSNWATRRGIPFAVQAAENMDRPLPWWVKKLRRRVLEDAALVIGRSPSALERVREWGFSGQGVLVVHGIYAAPRQPEPPVSPIIGVVGRLVTAKGVDDVIALARANPHWKIRVAGDGERSADLAAVANIELVGALNATDMSAFYDSVSVVIVPSRTTATWSEQFGRVIVEAVYAGRPVVAYDSGEIPWVSGVVGSTTVREGDVAALGTAVREWLDMDGDERHRRVTDMQAAITVNFTNEAAVQALSAALGL
jgi:glycosyltransferase involved in cell wall biosynthesis